MTYKNYKITTIKVFFPAYVTKSSRGEPKLFYKNFTYNRSYVNHRDTYVKWYCSSRNSKKCKANVVTDFENSILKVIGEHNHKSKCMMKCGPQPQPLYYIGI